MIGTLHHGRYHVLWHALEVARVRRDAPTAPLAAILARNGAARHGQLEVAIVHGTLHAGYLLSLAELFVLAGDVVRVAVSRSGLGTYRLGWVTVHVVDLGGI